MAETLPIVAHLAHRATKTNDAVRPLPASPTAVRQYSLQYSLWYRREPPLGSKNPSHVSTLHVDLASSASPFPPKLLLPCTTDDSLADRPPYWLMRDVPVGRGSGVALRVVMPILSNNDLRFEGLQLFWPASLELF